MHDDDVFFTIEQNAIVADAFAISGKRDLQLFYLGRRQTNFRQLVQGLRQPTLHLFREALESFFRALFEQHFIHTSRECFSSPPTSRSWWSAWSASDPSRLAYPRVN